MPAPLLLGSDNGLRPSLKPLRHHIRPQYRLSPTFTPGQVPLVPNGPEHLSI